MTCTGSPKGATYLNTQTQTQTQIPPISSASTPQQMLGTDSTVDKAGIKMKCSFCGTHSDTLKKCSHCGEAQYCGQGCQKKHWKEHRTTCSIESETYPNTHNHS